VRLPDDGSGALPLLRHIILNDDKSSTYKLALPGIGAHRVAKIMQPDVLELGHGPDTLPCRFDRGL
jgi:hypothetical protein